MRNSPSTRARASRVAALTFLVAAVAQAQAPGPADQHRSNVKGRVSGSKALETVAWLDRFVRWPGNPGFDSSIVHIADRLASAGFVEQSKAKAGDRMTYRVERYPLPGAAWEPTAASVVVVGASGGTAPVLAFATNRNMIATNSFSTAASGTEAELVRVNAVTPAALDSANVKGKIVMADGRLGALFTEAVQRRGAVGVLAYAMPSYTQPERYRTSIQFTSIPYDSARKSWGIALSFAAREQLRSALAAGPVRLKVGITTRFTAPATELGVVAEIRGSTRAEERFVWSAHVQEPGANDDASGVGALTEMARVAASLVKDGREDPSRTLTFLWGQEIRNPARFIQQDSARAAGIRWGMSLDMVGEDTRKTGGTFLIEKMPDPSAIWTRGDDHHTEWGSPGPMKESQLTPHYFNDFVLARCLEESKGTGWVVKTNPFEGGSDHTSFLNAKKPGLLLWHFTDAFYHTDADRMDKVSVSELEHTAVAALVSGLTLASADGRTARALVRELEGAATTRIAAERRLSADTLARGGSAEYERHIIETWGAWYRDAIKSTEDIEVGGSSSETRTAIAAAVERVGATVTAAVHTLRK